MPDPILGTAAGTTDQGQQGQPQQGQQPANGTTPATTEPVWLNAIQDQSMREEAKKSYLLNSDYTKKTQELAEQRKSWESEKEALKRQNEEYLQGWKASWNAYEEAQKKYQQNPTAANAQNVRDLAQESNEYWEGYDLMDGPKQGKHVAQYTAQQVTQYVNQLAQKFNEAYQQDKKQHQAYMDNYFATYLDAQQKFPGNPEQQKAYLNAMYQVRSGQADPRELAYQQVIAPSERERLLEEGRKLGAAEAEQRLKNQQQFDMNGTGTPQPYRHAPLADKKARDAELTQKITERFGFNVWNPNS